MTKKAVRNGVVRVQGNKLAAMLGMPEGTKVPKSIIEDIIKTPMGNDITVDGKTFKVSASMRSLAEILVGKGVIED